MITVEKKLGCALLAPDTVFDERGWFRIAFSGEEIRSLGFKFGSVYQLNHSRTETAGIVRGPNFQQRPFNQSKVVRVIRGSVFSVGIDIDPESETFGMAAGFLLSETNSCLMYIPNSYAHGFTVLEGGTELEYLTDNRYSREHAKSVWFADESIIDIDTGKPVDWSYGGAVALSGIKSEKNANAPLLRDLKKYL